MTQRPNLNIQLKVLANTLPAVYMYITSVPAVSSKVTRLHGGTGSSEESKQQHDTNH